MGEFATAARPAAARKPAMGVFGRFLTFCQTSPAGLLNHMALLFLCALLLSLVLLIGLQGAQILRPPLAIRPLAVPIISEVYVNAALAYRLNRALGVRWRVGAPSAPIGASNLFEPAVATAIMLVEALVMLTVVRDWRSGCKRA